MYTTVFLRRISTFVLITFISLTLQPLQAVAQDQLAQTKTVQPLPQTDDEQYGKLLEEIKTSVKKGVDKANKHQSTRDDTKTIRSQKVQLETLEKKVDLDFISTEQDLKAKNLSPEILARHQAAVQEYKTKRTEFKKKLKILDDADDADNESKRSATVQDLSNFLEQNQKSKTQSFDPNKLPWRTPDASSTRKPEESLSGLLYDVLKVKQVQLASNGSISGVSIPGSALPSTPAVEDTAATIDVQITPAIRAKAAELNNQPVQIYNWVRNNIEYVPTYGSVQGSQVTLDKKRGNAFDTSSLLIALLRAAGIPARYVYGTIRISAEQAKNWTGGTSTIEAAQQLFGQGGVPNVGLISGGQVSSLKLEHVWVEAYVDYIPSRGAINKTPNTWVPLDASYKQFDYQAGMDLKTAVPLDTQALLAAVQQGATVNTQEGWVQNFNSANLQNQLTSYQNNLQSYINQTKPNATVGDILGSKSILSLNSSILFGGLPYTVITKTAALRELPSSLRHQFQYKIYRSAFDRAIDSPDISYTDSLPNLAGKKLTLAYVPASKADVDLIASYLPKPHADGSPFLPSELPQSLPGYLIKVKPELRLEDQVVATGSVITMGSEMAGRGGFTQYNNLSSWDLTDDDSLVAGQASAIGISAEGISVKQLQDLQARVQDNQAKIQANNISGLTGENISGDLLTATLWSWFSASQTNSLTAQVKANIVEREGLSYGLVHAIVQPLTSWGVVTKVKFPGVNLDIGHVRNLTWDKANQKSNWINYNRLRGIYLSALEHEIPEKFLIDKSSCNAVGIPNPDPAKQTCSQAVSATKLIAVAQQQGQKIYTITQANQSVISQLSAHSSQTISTVQNAVAAGKEVTIHEKPLTISGWTGAGYTVIDQDTGAGGYLIEGGSNGGFLQSLFGALLQIGSWLTSLARDNPGVATIVGLILGSLAAAGVGGPIVLALAALSTIISLAIGLETAGLICGGVISVVIIAITVVGSFGKGIGGLSIFNAVNAYGGIGDCGI